MIVIDPYKLLHPGFTTVNVGEAIAVPEFKVIIAAADSQVEELFLVLI